MTHINPLNDGTGFLVGSGELPADADDVQAQILAAHDLLFAWTDAIVARVAVHPGGTAAVALAVGLDEAALVELLHRPEDCDLERFFRVASALGLVGQPPVDAARAASVEAPRLDYSTWSPTATARSKRDNTPPLAA